jgi:hypothetical protein
MLFKDFLGMINPCMTYWKTITHLPLYILEKRSEKKKGEKVDLCHFYFIKEKRKGIIVCVNNASVLSSVVFVSPIEIFFYKAG